MDLLMPLDLLFVMDPISTVSVKKDTTFAFMMAAQARGHRVLYATLDDLYARGDTPRVVVRHVELQARQGQHFSWLSAPEDVDMRSLSAVFMRKDPPFDMNFIFATYILSLAASDTLVLNDPQGLRDCNEKAYALNFPALIPPTLIARNPKHIKDFIAEQGRVVLKPLDGKGGEGILLVETGDLNTNSMIEMLTRYGKRFIMGQAFVPAARDGDKRVIMLDGEPLGAMLRVPASDDLRGNMSAGATTVACDLTPRDLEICTALAPRLVADGHIFVGIDILGDYLTEINVTSPTGVQEIRDLGGADIADAMIAWTERKLTA